MNQERMVRMFSQIQRWTHFHMIHFMLAFIITGLPLASPKFGFIAKALGTPIAFTAKTLGVSPFEQTMSAYAIGIQACRVLHRITALLALAVLIPFFVVEFFRSKEWQIWPEEWSFSAFANGIKSALSWYLLKKPQRFGKYDPAQKFYTWAAGIGFLLMYISGFVLWFRDYFTEGAWHAAHMIHSIVFYLALIFLIMHVVFATLIPEHAPGIEAMFAHGYAPEDWVKEHHPLWYEKIKG